jgi:Flp pilus assembly protein TadG
MSLRPKRRLEALRSDERAATAVEFAMLVTPFLALLMASIQLSMIFFAGQVLQTAAIESGRQLMTGTEQDAGATQQQFRQAVCNNAPIIFTCANIMVDVESTNSSSYSTLNTVPPAITYNAQGQPTTTFNYNPGGPGDIVVVHAMYDWPIFGGPFALGLANQSNGSYLLVGTTVFKNEPYT